MGAHFFNIKSLTDEDKQNIFNSFNPPTNVTGGTNYANLGDLNTFGDNNSLAGKKFTDLSSMNNTLALANFNASGSQRNPYLTSLYDETTYNNDLSKWDNPNASKPGGTEKDTDWFSGDKMKGYGAIMGGVGSLGSAWASLKNVGVAKQALAEQVAQWDRNYAAQKATTNNQIANQNAWKRAQGRSDMGTMIG